MHICKYIYIDMYILYEAVLNFFRFGVQSVYTVDSMCANGLLRANS